MKRLFPISFIALFLVVLLASGAHAPVIDANRPDIPSFVGYAPNRIVVKFDTPTLRKLNKKDFASGKTGISALDKVGMRFGVKFIRPQFHKAKEKKYKGRKINLAGWHKMKFAGNIDILSAVKQYKTIPGVIDAQPVGIHAVNVEPNDEFYDAQNNTEGYSQWHLSKIEAPAAWEIEAGSPGIIVAVADSGVRYAHKDLAGADASSSNPAGVNGNIWINSAEKNGQSGIDDDGNGYIDDWVGWDFVDDTSLVDPAIGVSLPCYPGEDCGEKDNDPGDFNGHGTHCAGIIAANTNNGYSIASPAGGWGNGNLETSGNGVKVMCLRIGWSATLLFWEVGLVPMDYAAEALYYAADNGAHIISCSWTADDSGGVGDAVDYFLASGGLIFKATGNESNEVLDYFATIPSECVVDVAATDQDDCKASFSKYGEGIDISAPGVNILSLHNSRENPEEDRVTYMDGTSMACPLAASVAAMIWSRNPSWSATQVVQQLFDSADDIYSLACNTSYEGKLGAGRINAYNAVDTEPTPPVADFAGAPTSGCAPLGVSFSNQSIGDITSWNWDFGDGNFSTLQNPSHTYQTAGNYTVSLTVQGPGGTDAETKVDYITASAPPCADFSANIQSGNAPLTVAFTDLSIGNPTSWAWDFGDGIGTSNIQNPTYTYNNAGNYTVSLAIDSPEGSDNETKADYISVYLPPVADFSASPLTGSAPLSASFTDLSTGNPASWAWDFGDGIGTSTDQNPTYTYASGGTYTISLTVNNPEGSDNETKVDYVSVYAPPVADFSADPMTGTVPLTVAFTDLSSGNPIPISWVWDFGNGIGTSADQNPTYTYDNAGAYSVSLTVTNSEGSDNETKIDYITVDPPPGADFSANPLTGPAPLTVSFTDLSTGNPFSWSWNFGDSSYSSFKNPTHTYNNAGTYTVSLFAVGAGWSDNETKTGYITVSAPPVADFSASPLTASAPATVSFSDLSTGYPTSWAWDFGDGIGTSTAQNPTYTYDNAGTYTVSLTVANSAGSDNETKAGYITMSLGPVADFSASPMTGTAPLTVSFSDLSTGNPASWAWDFGNGIGTSTYQNPTYTYDSAGAYSVSLTVTNSEGSDNETKIDYISVDPPPGADFSANPLTGPAPLTVSFTDLSAGNPFSWSWNFGDSSYSSVKNPTHTYNNAGTYTVSLFAVGAGWSDNEIKTGYITVSAPPVADFSASPLTASAPATVSFSDLSTGNPTSWAWDFGDGIGTSAAQNPTYTYDNAGTYTVSLTVANSAGSDNETKAGYITMSLGPVADFSSNPPTGTAPLTVSFSDLSTGNPTSWAWDFGDGIGTSTYQNPTYTYDNVGAYSVSLTVSNAEGSDNETKVDYITVNPPLGADFSASPLTGPAPLTVSFTDLSTGNPFSWSWNFGDGSYSSVKNPTHTYSNAGTYTVFLFVVGAGWSDNELKIGYITVL